MIEFEFIFLTRFTKRRFVFIFGIVDITILTLRKSNSLISSISSASPYMQSTFSFDKFLIISGLKSTTRYFFLLFFNDPIILWPTLLDPNNIASYSLCMVFSIELSKSVTDFLSNKLIALNK